MFVEELELFLYPVLHWLLKPGPTIKENQTFSFLGLEQINTLSIPSKTRFIVYCLKQMTSVITSTVQIQNYVREIRITFLKQKKEKRWRVRKGS